MPCGNGCLPEVWLRTVLNGTKVRLSLNWGQTQPRRLLEELHAVTPA
jgi:hypothetical protein